MINANLAAAFKEAGLSCYVNNDEENVEDEKKDRVLLAQLVETAKGFLSSFFCNSSTFMTLFFHYLKRQPVHSAARLGYYP